MLYKTENLRDGIPLNSLPRISTQEAVDYIDLNVIPMRTSKRLGCSIVALENAYKYIKSHDSTFANFIQEVSHVNSLDYDHMAFSVKPSSVYKNNVIREMYMNLQEHNIPVYLQNDYNSREYKIIDLVCEECIRTNSLKPYEIIIEGWLDSIVNGGMEGAADAGGGFLKGMANTVMNNIGSGFRDAALNKIDKTLFGRFDGTKYDPQWNAQTGQWDKKEVADRGAKTKEWLQNSKLFNNKFFNNNPNWKKNTLEFATDTIKDLRSGISSGVLNQLQSLVGIDPSKPLDIDNVFNAIDNKIKSVRARPGSGGGIMTSLINKLIALKNHLMSVFKKR